VPVIAEFAQISVAATAVIPVVHTDEIAAVVAREIILYAFVAYSDFIGTTKSMLSTRGAVFIPTIIAANRIAVFVVFLASYALRYVHLRPPCEKRKGAPV
jgi:hypothetical protein